jgi:hypothetical protein
VVQFTFLTQRATSRLFTATTSGTRRIMVMVVRSTSMAPRTPPPTTTFPGTGRTGVRLSTATSGHSRWWVATLSSTRRVGTKRSVSSPPVACPALTPTSPIALWQVTAVRSSLEVVLITHSHAQLVPVLDHVLLRHKHAGRCLLVEHRLEQRELQQLRPGLPTIKRERLNQQLFLPQQHCEFDILFEWCIPVRV